MPSGIYSRDGIPPGTFKRGNIPHNKGYESPKKLKKVECFRLGLPVFCKRHGLHTRWRLHTGNNVQCKDCVLLSNKNQRRRDPLRFIFRDAQQHAQRRNTPFAICLDDLRFILELQKNKCALTNIEFNQTNPPSLDRINPELGYVKENIQFVLIKINIMKSNLFLHEFLDLCRKVVNKN